MSLMPRPTQWGKHCLVYCGERCDCGASAEPDQWKQHQVAREARRVREEERMAKLRVELYDRLEKARNHVMTPKEVYDQKVSWIWGEMNMGRASGDDHVTIEQVKAHLAAHGFIDPAP